MHFLERRHLADTFVCFLALTPGLTIPAVRWALSRKGAISTSTEPSRRRFETVSLPARSLALAWNSYGPGARFESSTGVTRWSPSRRVGSAVQADVPCLRISITPPAMPEVRSATATETVVGWFGS
jgi:hypothetical protein